jgi:hypothetical protein
MAAHGARPLCEQQSPNKRDLISVMRRLGGVHPGQLQHESREEAAIFSIKALLGCGGHGGGADDVCLLFATSKAVPKHSTLWARALWSRALVPALTALMDTCARAVGTYLDVGVSDGNAATESSVHVRHVLARARQARHNGPRRKRVGKHVVR